MVRFPDAPTLRGVKHLQELEEARRAGYRTAVCFVIQMENVSWFEPNAVSYTHLFYYSSRDKIRVSQGVSLCKKELDR